MILDDLTWVELALVALAAVGVALLAGGLVWFEEPLSFTRGDVRRCPAAAVAV